MESKFWYWKYGSVISGNNHHWDGTSGGQHDHTYCMVMSGTRWQYRACNVPHIHLCKSVLSRNAIKPNEQYNIHSTLSIKMQRIVLSNYSYKIIKFSGKGW